MLDRVVFIASTARYRIVSNVFIASTARYRIVSNVFTGQKFLDMETNFL